MMVSNALTCTLACLIMAVAHGGGCAGRACYRRLGEYKAVTPDQVLASCNNDKTIYESFVQVHHTHLLIVAKSESCPNLAFHSSGNNKKEIVMIEDWGPEESLHKLDEYSLQDLLQAFGQVESSSSIYDIVTNNCASFVLDMACFLGYVATPEILSWIADRLTDTQDSTTSIMDSLRVSPHLGDLPMVTNDEGALDDRQKDVIAELVYYYAASHEGTCVSKKGDNENKKERVLTIALVAEALFWMAISLSCFCIGRSFGAKPNAKDVDDSKTLGEEEQADDERVTA